MAPNNLDALVCAVVRYNPKLCHHTTSGTKSKDIDALDWGVLAVYTCKASCDIGETYAQEFIWKNPIAEEVHVKRKVPISAEDATKEEK
jgi:hypothetical protein